MEPRPASTTVLVRSGPAGPELLFVQRPQSMRAFGGFHAFPGGALDPGDFSDRAAAISTLSPQEAERTLGDAAGGHPALGFFVCALREVFEEVGLLYAADGESPVVLAGDQMHEARRRVLDGAEPFAGILEALGLRLATHRLRFHARWRAPASLPVRFDARVFVAPALGEPDPDPDEVDAVAWFTTGQALALTEAGAIKMAPPTVATVSSLARFPTAEAMLSGADVAGERRRLERHSPLVRRLVAPNPSVMTGPGSNTYLVGERDLVVIDPGSMDPGHLSEVAGAGKVRTIVVTHGHPDHSSGAADLAEMTGAELAGSKRFADRAIPPAVTRILAGGDAVEVPGVRLEVIETPGHASDHICLWMPSEGAVFSGDLVLGEGTAVISPPDGNLVDYLRSLERVRALSPKRLYPGHYAPRDDAAEWIEFYIRHRKEREEEILACLSEGRRRVEEIVVVVYASYPPQLHPIAARSVLAHLQKLEAEGRVSLRDDAWGRRAQTKPQGG